MTFKCTCGATSYQLFCGIIRPHIGSNPEYVVMITDDTDIWWEATCKGCGRCWGHGRDYTTRSNLRSVMEGAGVLKHEV